MKARAAAIVPAAGIGRRLGMKTGKPFVRLGGKPLVSYALRALDAAPEIGAIYIAAEPGSVARLAALVRRLGIRKVAAVTAGGDTRAASVAKCLALVDPRFDIVLIHDAARPFLERAMVRDAVRFAARYGGCIVAAPMHDTVKEVSGGLMVRRTLDRSRLYRAQTPQAFRRRLLERAYRRAGARAAHATDDARLIEMLGGNVRIRPGSGRNMKVTTKEDLIIAEALL